METSDTITGYLNGLATNELYQTLAVLKISTAEKTELVQDNRGTTFLRKIMTRESGIGGAYAQIKAAQDAGLDTWYLPRVYQYLRTESSTIVVMEYVSGSTLDIWAEAHGYGVSAAEAIFPQLCAAVEALHTQFTPSIIHRDLKPSNVMVSADGTVKLLDFGIAREYREGAERDTRFLGTRAYAPPEQFGFKQTDERSDIYSLGMILYHLLTGETPRAALHEEGFVDARIPERLRTVLLQATAFDPDQRFSRAGELELAFNQALEPSVSAPKTRTATASPDAPGYTYTSLCPAPSAAPGTTAPAAPAQAAAAISGTASPQTAGRAAAQTSSSTHASAAQQQPWTFRAVFRDVIAIILLAGTGILCFVSTRDAGAPANVGEYVGELFAGIAFFLPAIPTCYYISSKRLMKRWFPKLATWSHKKEALMGVVFLIAALVVAFVAVVLFVAFSSAGAAG